MDAQSDTPNTSPSVSGRRRAGIMQPYFFPYIGYFALIADSDVWAVFDVAQFTPKSWMSRNRVLHPSESWMYVTVNLSNASRNCRIDEARILDTAATRRSLVGKLAHYRRFAPHYREVMALIDRTFDSCQGDSLVGLDVAGIVQVCDYLRLRLDLRVCSEMDPPVQDAEHPGAWAPAIAASLGASEYVNPVGGRDLFRPEDFSERGIDLYFLTMPEIRYPTGPFTFVPSLSILDVLMWCEVDEVRAMLARRQVEPATCS